MKWSSFKYTCFFFVQEFVCNKYLDFIFCKHSGHLLLEVQLASTL